jgi:hypothetical protein
MVLIVLMVVTSIVLTVGRGDRLARFAHPRSSYYRTPDVSHRLEGLDNGRPGFGPHERQAGRKGANDRGESHALAERGDQQTGDVHGDGVTHGVERRR